MFKLNHKGFAHTLILMSFVVLFAVCGVGFMVASRAASPNNTWAITYYSPYESAAGSCKYKVKGVIHTAPPTASQTCAKQGRTIAVNPKLIPYGTKVCIKGVGTRVAEDTGDPKYFDEASAKQFYGKPGHIDVFINDQQKALKKGVKFRKVTKGACGTPAPTPILSPTIMKHRNPQ